MSLLIISQHKFTGYLFRVGTHIPYFRPQIENMYPLEQARQAYERLLEGHLRGKLVLRV